MKLLIPFIIIVLTSCNFYKPTSVFNPKLENKGDLNINGSVGSSLELNAAFAVSDKIGIFASATDSYSLEYEIQNSNTGIIEQFRIPNNRYDIGIGKFMVDSTDFSWSAYGGYSVGNAGTLEDFFFNNILIDDYGYRSKFHGPFLQASVSSTFKKKSYLSFLGKLNYLRFYDFEFTTQERNRYLADEWNWVYQLGLELGSFNRRVGSNVQINYALTNGNENYLSARNVNVNFNLFIKINTRKKQRDNSN